MKFYIFMNKKMRVMFCVFILIFNLIALTYTTKIRSIMEISALSNNSTFIRNEQELLEKLNNIIIGGSDLLQIVTDYDLTLTADPADSGKRVLNSFEMLRLCPSIPQSYKDADTELYYKYKPIESNPNMNLEEKSKSMLEWYKSSHNLLRGLKYPREEMKDLAKNVSNCFREGVDKLVSWSANNNVPLLVLSSGLGDAVVATMEAANLMGSNVKVISNFIEVNNDGLIIGMKGDPIHSYNKNEASIQHSDYYNSVKQRSNVLLMGDSLGDANMTDGMDNLDSVVKIGFLGNNKRKYLEAYINNFDIVLINDQTMDVINGIINRLF